MLPYIAYMDPMGNGNPNAMGIHVYIYIIYTYEDQPPRGTQSNILRGPCAPKSTTQSLFPSTGGRIKRPMT